MTKKQLLTSTRGTYIAPECEALEIKSQGMVCQSDPILALSLELDRDGGYGDVIDF